MKHVPFSKECHRRVIKPSTRLWASHIVKKRWIDQVLRQESESCHTEGCLAYSLPKVDDIFGTLTGSQDLSTLVPLIYSAAIGRLRLTRRIMIDSMAQAICDAIWLVQRYSYFSVADGVSATRTPVDNMFGLPGRCNCF